MDQIDERLIEEIRKHDHLYNSSSSRYKDCQISKDSWREISMNIGLDVGECLKRWKNIRDKYVRMRKRLTARGETSGKKVPALVTFLSWLAPYIKHRDTENDAQEGGSGEPSSPSRVGRKRKRRDMDGLYSKQLADLEDRRNELDRRLELHQRAAQDRDECSRFGETATDFLRRVPDDKRPDVMLKILQILHESVKQ